MGKISVKNGKLSSIIWYFLERFLGRYCTIFFIKIRHVRPITTLLFLLFLKLSSNFLSVLFPFNVLFFFPHSLRLSRSFSIQAFSDFPVLLNAFVVINFLIFLIFPFLFPAKKERKFSLRSYYFPRIYFFFLLLIPLYLIVT